MQDGVWEKLKSMEFASRREAYEWLDKNVGSSDLIRGEYQLSTLNYIRDILESRIRRRFSPCPFCPGWGMYSIKTSRYPRQPENEYATFFSVECSRCKATGPHANSEEEAMDAWNDRQKGEVTCQ